MTDQPREAVVSAAAERRLWPAANWLCRPWAAGRASLERSS